MIDFSSYTLTEKNFFSSETEKKQVVIGNTFNVGMNHYLGWLHRSGGNYKKTANFTVDIDGKIYQHFDPKYFSEFLPNSIYNKNIISVLLVNQGWLEYDLKDKKYIDCLGNYYNGNKMTEKRWRNHSFWDNYTDKQMKSLVELIEYLFKEYKISKRVLSHNTYVRDIFGFEGITYRSNWIKDSTDLSPSFNFDIFKEKIENNEIQ